LEREGRAIRRVHGIKSVMRFSQHINLTGGALRRWFVAQCYDSLAVGALWWFGLDYLHVPCAPFWSILAAGLQFIPHLGPVLAFMGPALVALFAGGFGQFLYVLILYAAIIVIDGLVLQPVIMRRTARVPIWASLIVPILLSMIFGFWGLLLAAPLLGVIFAYRAHGKRAESSLPRQTPPGQEITGGRLISPDTPTGHIPHHDETL
jgi:predicted PurR-regulated permease PerM